MGRDTEMGGQDGMEDTDLEYVYPPGTKGTHHVLPPLGDVVDEVQRDLAQEIRARKELDSDVAQLRQLMTQQSARLDRVEAQVKMQVQAPASPLSIPVDSILKIGDFVHENRAWIKDKKVVEEFLAWAADLEKRELP